METPKLKYIRFPVSLIQDYLVDSRVGLNKMLVYGYCLASERMDCDLITACRQVLYCFYSYVKKSWEDMEGKYQFMPPASYRNRLPQKLLRWLYDMWQDGDLDINETYFGWDGIGKLDLECAEYRIEELCGEDYYPEMRAEIMDFHRLRQAADLFGITVKNMDMVMTEYRQIRDTNHKGWRSSVPTKYLFDYLHNEKSEQDKMLLALIIGIRSIIHEYSVINRTEDKYCRTTKTYMQARMFGCKNEQELKYILQHGTDEKAKVIQELHKKYTTIKMFKNLKDELLERGFVREFYPVGKGGTFICCGMKHDRFIKIVAKELLNKTGFNKSRIKAKDYRKIVRDEVNEEIRRMTQT